MVSNTTAGATTTDAAVEIISAATFGAQPIYNITIINEGTIAGFFSVDGGIGWQRLPATVASTNPVPLTLRSQMKAFSGGVQIKRIASGTNLANVWAYGWA